MPKKIEISQEQFGKLLNWLSSDKEIAGRKYESIRNRLISIFYAQGCYIAEELADNTIDIVTSKIDQLFKTYEGEPSLYFYGVAKKVFLEYSRKPKFEELPHIVVKEKTVDEEAEVYYECLDKCLEKMLPAQQRLIIDYYQGEKHTKIEQRRKMEKYLGISNQALRVRVLRLRVVLQKCVLGCVKENLY